MSLDAKYIKLLNNTKYEILTDKGFKDFKGLGISKNKTTIKIYTENYSIEVTPEHQLYNEKFEPVYANKLYKGDKLITSTGIECILKLESFNKKVLTYDPIHVEDTHSYFANNIKNKNCLYLDEFAIIPKHIIEHFYASVYGTISGKPNGQIIISSTPKGINLFYEIWKKACLTENGYIPIRVNWWEMEGRDENWKKNTIRDVGAQKFAQEFDCQFLGSSTMLIAPIALEAMKYKDALETKYNGAMEIWEHPKEKSLYVMGVDTGKGIGADSSTICVLRIESTEEIYQVATYKSDMILPYDYAEIVNGISEYYNAYIMIENNDQGATVADKLWYEFENPRILNCDKKGIGIRATKKSKPDACLHMKRLIDNGFVKINHFETIRQLSIFEEVSPNVFKCPRMEHDDCVMSLLWALYFTITPFYDELSNKADSKKLQTMNDNFNNGETRMKIDFDDEDEVSMPSINSNYNTDDDSNFWNLDD